MKKTLYRENDVKEDVREKAVSDEIKEVNPEEALEEKAPKKEPVLREGTAFGDFEVLNVRKTPSAKSERNIIAQIKKGSKVTIISDHDDFLFVKFDTGSGIGGEGYVMKKFIKEA